MKELSLQKNFLNEPVESIYFGGGTPSLLQKEELNDLLMTVKDNFTLDAQLEITLEANPDDLSKAKLEDFKELGINRLSIGIQSFIDDNLQFTNRAHSSREAIESFHQARAVGFDNISIDLMYGIPGLSMSDWQHNLSESIALGAEHLSAYCLTIEQKTVFGRWQQKGKLQKVSDELAAEQYEMMVDMLKKAGYHHYEVSNFCKENYNSRHNSSYWFGQAYLGVGPSAHSFDGQRNRYFNVANNSRYIAAIESNIIPNELDRLDDKDLINEHILTRLRTSKGIDINFLIGLEYDLLNLKQKEIQLYQAKNWLQIKDNLLILTDAGRLLADEITLELMTE